MPKIAKTKYTPVPATTATGPSFSAARRLGASNGQRSDRSETVFFQKVGRRLAQRRHTLRLTQQQLSRRSGIDRAHLSLLESGKRHATLHTLRALSKELKVPLGELLRGL